MLFHDNAVGFQPTSNNGGNIKDAPVIIETRVRKYFANFTHYIDIIRLDVIR